MFVDLIAKALVQEGHIETVEIPLPQAAKNEANRLIASLAPLREGHTFVWC